MIKMIEILFWALTVGFSFGTGAQVYASEIDNPVLSSAVCLLATWFALKKLAESCGLPEMWRRAGEPEGGPATRTGSETRASAPSSPPPPKPAR